MAFEDVLGGGDRNFRDMVFSFTNVHGTDTPPVPEPSTPVAVTVGAAGLRAHGITLSPAPGAQVLLQY